MNMHMPAKQ